MIQSYCTFANDLAVADFRLRLDAASRTITSHDVVGMVSAFVTLDSMFAPPDTLTPVGCLLAGQDHSASLRSSHAMRICSRKEQYALPLLNSLVAGTVRAPQPH